MLPLPPAGEAGFQPSAASASPTFRMEYSALIAMTTFRGPVPPSAAVSAEDVSLAARGDVRAFERLYRQHGARIHALARRMIGEDDAAEVTQDVFVRAWQKLSSFRGDSAFGTWLHRIAINVVLTRRAQYGKRRDRFDADPETLERVEAKASQRELGMDFERAIDELPEGARHIFVLHDVEGYTHEEIGGLLGVAAGTSKAQLHRARMLLRRHLGKE
jgi:RNA polymerase sigma-70 factor (ECF subfamily)